MVGWHHRLNGQNLSKLQKTVKGGKSGMLQSMGLQRVGHDLMTEQQSQGGSSGWKMLSYGTDFRF